MGIDRICPNCKSSNTTPHNPTLMWCLNCGKVFDLIEGKWVEIPEEEYEDD